MTEERYSCKQVIKAIEGSGGVKKIIAERLGCSRWTVDNYLKRHPTVVRAFEQERERIIDVAESKLSEKVKQGHWSAIRYLLSTRGKTRGYVERQEIEQINSDEVERAIEHELEKLAAVRQAPDASEA